MGWEFLIFWCRHKSASGLCMYAYKSLPDYISLYITLTQSNPMSLTLYFILTRALGTVFYIGLYRSTFRDMGSYFYLSLLLCRFFLNCRISFCRTPLSRTDSLKLRTGFIPNVRWCYLRKLTRFPIWKLLKIAVMF
jgi:hypothetical protein